MLSHEKTSRGFGRDRFEHVTSFHADCSDGSGQVFSRRDLLYKSIMYVISKILGGNVLRLSKLQKAAAIGTAMTIKRVLN